MDEEMYPEHDPLPAVRSKRHGLISELSSMAIAGSAAFGLSEYLYHDLNRSIIVAGLGVVLVRGVNVFEDVWREVATHHQESEVDN